MQKAAIEPDVDYYEEHDGYHEREVDAANQAEVSGAPVTQDGADRQLEGEQDQSDGGEPETVGEARRDVPRPQSWPSVPQRYTGKGHGEPVMRPKWQKRRRHRGVARPAPPDDQDIQVGNGDDHGKQCGAEPAALAGWGKHGE